MATKTRDQARETRLRGKMAEEHTDDITDDDITDAQEHGDESITNALIAKRERQRHIKLHKKDREAPPAPSEAIVKTKDGLPDMRVAENKNAFSVDPSKTVSGEPDQRFLENRKDLQDLHAVRGEDKPNVIFGDDGKLKSE